MGKAGQALKQVLTSYDISQSQLATELGVELPIVFRWFHEQTDPTAETVAEIVRAIQIIDPEASREFVELYLGHLTTNAPMNLIRLDSGQLPESDQVDVVALSRLFSNTTTSYKYLFFLSLLDILKRRQFEVLSLISFKEIIVEMLANAWYPHTYFKLSFGTQDKIAQKLDSLTLEITDPILKFTDTNKNLLRKTIVSQDLRNLIIDLKRYVPFRLIAPFLEAELKAANVSKGRGNDLPSETYFNDFVELQYFGLTASYQVLSHQKWLKAVESHISELKMSDAEDLLDIEKLRKAYELMINPLMSLATIQGFSPDWSYH